MSAIALRPYLTNDGARCLSIFAASIAELAREDYSEEQCEAWIAVAEDQAGFQKRLQDQLTLIASFDGEIAGFASLKGADSVDMIYVDPEFARKGVGAALLDALARLAAARGTKSLTSDVSDTAKPLFERLGYAAQRRNLVTLGDEWLANTTMTKTLAAPGASPTARH
jgi:putative acetyltransferase